MVLGLDITEVSAKVRTGGPLDAEDDYALPCWAGVVPLAVQAKALPAAYRPLGKLLTELSTCAMEAVDW